MDAEKKRSKVNWYGELHPVVRELAATWEERNYWDEAGPIPIPSQEEVIRIIHRIRRILFPGYFSPTNINPENLQYYLGEEITITKVIGSTPLVRLKRLTENLDTEVYGKLESQNPLSSVKPEFDS